VTSFYRPASKLTYILLMATAFGDFGQWLPYIDIPPRTLEQSTYYETRLICHLQMAYVY